MMAAIVPDVRLQVHECLRYLASRRDDADEDGFKRVDALFGRWLAETDGPTLAQVIVGAKLIRRYRRQLEGSQLHAPTQSEVEAYLAVRLTSATRRQAARHPGAVSNKSGNRVYILNRFLVVECPSYDEAKYRAIAPLKRVPGWRFNRFVRREWSFPLEAANTVLDALKPFRDFVYSDDIPALVAWAKEHEELEKAFAKLERQAALTAVEPFLAGEPIANGQALFEHQREAVRFLIERKRVILAHDLGLGKTRTALIAAKGYELPVIVICPAGLKINWRREAEAVHIPIQVYSWAKLPRLAEDDDYILIADEAHYAQTLSAKRTQGFLKLAESARAMYALTGTPIKNGRPINLYPLLIACKHPLVQDRRAYEEYYCDAKKRIIGGKEVYDVSGALHLDELRDRTRDVMLYKKKEDCLKNLPPKVRVMRQVDVSQEAKRAYQAMINRLWQEHWQRMREKREGRDSTALEELGFKKADRDEMDDEQAEALVELGILRQAGSMIKVESAIDIAQEVLQQEESIVLFTAYRKSAEKIAEALDAELIYADRRHSGDAIAKERQAIVDRFQSKEKRALVCLIGTGGIGYTLTAAQTAVLVDRLWTPTDAEQCESRLDRIGQQGSVTAIWLQYGAIDKRIDALLQQKQERINVITRGKRKAMRGVESIRSMAKEILESVQSDLPIAQLSGRMYLAAQEEEQSRANSNEDSIAAHSNPAQEPPGPAGSLVLTTEVKPVVPSLREPEHGMLPPAGHDQTIPPESQAQSAAEKKDGRLKGEVPRVRVNIMLDEQVVDFLRSMKASNQTSSKESGYSGFLERLVKASEEFKAYQNDQV